MRRFQLNLIYVFMGMALLITAIGIYGMLVYHIAARTREIGLRQALGATSRDVMWMISGQIARWLLAGAVVGTLITLGAGRVLRAVFYDTNPWNPLHLAVSLLVIVIVATVASLIPALRATRLDPVDALRSE